MPETPQMLFETIHIVVDVSPEAGEAINTGLELTASCDSVVDTFSIVDTRSESGHWDVAGERGERIISGDD